MKRYIKIIIISIILFSVIGFAQAATTIIKDYPEIGGINPGKEGTTLPDFIKYIFLFSLTIVGIVGLLAIIIGAFGYLTAVGNPQKASEAKNKIISAILICSSLSGKAIGIALIALLLNFALMEYV